MRVAVVRFPGSNCEAETAAAVEAAGAEAEIVWHRDASLGGADVVVLPGGFAYGDYLRAGAIARFSPIMSAVVAHARAGGPTLGICNGFQVLCEAGLLPGALMRNVGLRFLSRPVRVRVESTDTPFTSGYSEGAIVTMPIAHGEGRYVADAATLAAVVAGGQIVFRYAGENPNGSLEAIAGVSNPGRNVVGLMPHPERCASPLTGGTDGAGVFHSLMHQPGFAHGGAR